MDRELFSHETVSENLRLYQELINCGNNIYHWIYSSEGALLFTNCPEHILNLVFMESGCLDALLNDKSTAMRPVYLSAQLGLQWCGAVEDTSERYYHVFGPTFSADPQIAGLEASLKQFPMPRSFFLRLIKVLEKLSSVSTTMLLQYAVMLHYCVTGESLGRDEVVSLTSKPRSPSFFGQDHSGKSSSVQPPTDARRQNRMAEQALLEHVKTGNFNYQKVLNNAGNISHGTKINSMDPVKQNAISVVIFTSLCTRAAIEGGLCADVAYSLGDSYIEKVFTAKTPTELRIIADDMYDTFIQQVHNLKQNHTVSPLIANCIQYICSFPEEDLSIGTLAQRIGYTEYYLSRKFKKEVGVSINEYIREKRIRYGEMLLKTTDLSIYQIAEQLRFCSSTHFSSCFRNITGILPADYRQQHSPK